MKNDELNDLDFGDWPLPEEWLVELGRIGALWTSLEMQVNLAIGKLAGFDDITDPRPYILVAHSNFQQRLDIISTLCEHLLPTFPQLKDYKQVISLIGKAKGQRNRFAHNGIAPSPDGSGKMQTASVTARGTLKCKVEDLCIADIKRVVTDINEASQALMNLVYETDFAPKWRRETEQSAGERTS